MSTDGIDLDPDQETILLAAARRVAPRWQDEFFKDVADQLRPIRDLRTSDVHHACAIALGGRTATVKDRNEAANV